MLHENGGGLKVNPNNLCISVQSCAWYRIEHGVWSIAVARHALRANTNAET